MFGYAKVQYIRERQDKCLIYFPLFFFTGFQNKLITYGGQLGFGGLIVFKYHYEFVNLILFGGFQSIAVIVLIDP